MTDDSWREGMPPAWRAAEAALMAYVDSATPEERRGVTLTFLLWAQTLGLPGESWRGRQVLERVMVEVGP